MRSRILRRAGLAAALLLLAASGSCAAAADAPLDPKHHLPAASFAYVGDPADPATWKLPYRHADGSPDGRRLPLAIEAVLGTYRGGHAKIPPAARHQVLEDLAAAARELHRMPPEETHPRPLYRKLAAAIAAR
jgi:hypothetical protein